VKTLIKVIIGLGLLFVVGAQAQVANTGHAADAGSVDGSGTWPPTPTHYQTGSVTLAVSTTSYSVTFSPALDSAPSAIVCNVYMKDADGEIMYASVRADSVTSSGFTVVLSGSPTATGGFIKWIASL